ncbi:MULTISPECIES: ATP-binding protein [Nesterenkonia]|uniref:Sensor-like histidine kinase SenX3 n=2 Tax=Nesterenkonia TaxID=57494 RepID=A0A839FKV3_9MICC|nr:ATP-binding protein [Nesterenkonia jeotgali]MBA8920089.1 two-component system sensor histidine kinase SenX3 [Nesterenkonia jeotgali]NYJ15710.1 two-component system sensor histidine kinase SenX3 [Nesterenkonia sandarakina]
MDPLLIAALSGVVGLALGVVGMYAFRVSEAQRGAGIDVDEPSMPAGATEVLASLGLAYIVVDTVDGVVRANPAAYAFGLVRGHTVVHQQLLALTARVRGDGVIIDQEHELARGLQGETSLVVHLRVAPLGDEYILVLADDRTEFSRIEAVRNDFVANVSHELKTPVGAISLLAETIEDAADDDVAVRRFTQRLHKESRRLAALVQDIIELSRVQGKNVVHAGRPVDLEDVIADAADRSRLPAEAKNIELKIGGALPHRVHGDADQLAMAFRNLIDNAVRYSPESTRVGIGLSSRDGIAQVTITDQGIGIAKENQERIFERFYRVDAARSRQTGGTGLGLSIVKHVITNHGGEVALWSQQGRGSTFTVRLPELDESLDTFEGLGRGMPALTRAEQAVTEDTAPHHQAEDPATPGPAKEETRDQNSARRG